MNFQPVHWDDFQPLNRQQYFCANAPLSCPGHRRLPDTPCVPPAVELTEVDVIYRKLPTVGQAHLHLVEQLFDPAGSPNTARLETAPTVNVSLLLDVLAFLDRNPSRWTQHRYLAEVNGEIVGCIAGWAVVMGGMEPGDPEFIISARDGMELHRRGRELLALTEWQAGAIFGFVHVASPYGPRHPTFRELCEHIFEVTRVRYEPQGAVA